MMLRIGPVLLLWREWHRYPITSGATHASLSGVLLGDWFLGVVQYRGGLNRAFLRELERQKKRGWPNQRAPGPRNGPKFTYLSDAPRIERWPPRDS